MIGARHCRLFLEPPRRARCRDFPVPRRILLESRPERSSSFDTKAGPPLHAIVARLHPDDNIITCGMHAVGNIDQR